MINNKKNNLFTIGVEEEYMLCDPNTGDLINKAYDLMDLISEDHKERFSYELLLSEIESNTKICKDTDEAINDIIFYRNLLNDIGKKINYQIGISGTHPTALSSEQQFINNESYDWVSNELKYYASKNITFSTHVHIGINDPKDSIHITNIARRWIAPMLALSANSPFFEGNLTGMKSSRTFQFGLFPRTNIPNYINSIDDYLDIIKKFKLTNSITKSRQIWWKIRPHINYGTVEFRMCDAQRSLRNIKAFISIFQSLVHRIYNDKSTLVKYNQEFLNDSLWKASSKDFNVEIIDPYDNKIITMKDMINKLLDYIKPSLLYFNNYNSTIDIINDIVQNGTECDLQLNEYHRFDDSNKGIDNLKKYLMNNVEYSL